MPILFSRARPVPIAAPDGRGTLALAPDTRPFFFPPQARAPASYLLPPDLLDVLGLVLQWPDTFTPSLRW